MLQVLLQLMSAQIFYNRHRSFPCFNMKRPREEDANCGRGSKIQTGSSYWSGCPWCHRQKLSYREWAAFSTNFNPKETYECCKPCLRHFMEQHWPVLKWWKWNGEGDA